MNKKKMIAPIVITVIVVLYYLAFAWVCITMDLIPLFAKILGGIIPLFIAGLFIYVLIDRIKEIKNEDDDDLSKYWFNRTTLYKNNLLSKFWKIIEILDYNWLTNVLGTYD